MLRFVLLGSGSSGNATLVYSGNNKILIDAGFSLRQLQQRVEATGQSLDGLDAVFVTHEHTDHVQGLGVLARRVGVPIYLTQGTFESLPEKVGALPDVRFFESGDTLEVGDLRVSSFGTAHDASDPVSYTVACGAAKVGFATDLGHYSHLTRARLAGSHALVLESNYCPEMLRTGPYPPEVQQRIRGRNGHLSNQDMTALLGELLHQGLRTVVLFHISENNNSPERVHTMATGAVRGHGARVYLATQDAPTEVFEVQP